MIVDKPGSKIKLQKFESCGSYDRNYLNIMSMLRKLLSRISPDHERTPNHINNITRDVDKIIKTVKCTVGLICIALSEGQTSVRRHYRSSCNMATPELNSRISNESLQSQEACQNAFLMDIDEIIDRVYPADIIKTLNKLVVVWRITFGLAILLS